LLQVHQWSQITKLGVNLRTQAPLSLDRRCHQQVQSQLPLSRSRKPPHISHFNWRERGQLINKPVKTLA